MSTGRCFGALLVRVLALPLAFSVALGIALAACGPKAAGVPVPGYGSATKTSSAVRAERRLFEGAPPVIPHQPFGAPCISCHQPPGLALAGVGFAPASPHAGTPGLGNASRCQQCHVFQRTTTTWKRNSFAGMRQDLRHGERLNPLAPPVMPHPLFLHEACLTCHDGPGAREEIRTTHPERVRCQQCHAAQQTLTTFPVAAASQPAVGEATP